MATEETAVPASELTRLIDEDPYVRQIMAAVRSGSGCSLDVAVGQLKELFGDDDVHRLRVDEAADKIREAARRTTELTDPRGLFVAGRPSWYPGPREDDRHWPVLRRLIEREGWDAPSIDALDKASTKVLAHLADPHDEQFDRKGLVLGYVQSGKTTNFTAVIAKAADAGYSFFIVLSGIHNGLRLQTQERLSQQLWDQSRTHWHQLTAEEDFRPTASVDAMLTLGDQKILAVVKKNGARLRGLKRWLEGAHPETLARCSFLIIDDEADQASINTAKPEDDPSKINQLIRQTLAALPRVSYVGYTATPFANVLIDPAVPEDLYPRDFIIDLPRPREYVGPEALFGREPLEFDDSGEQPDDGHDLIREVPREELDELKPKSPSQRGDFEPSVTDSLACAVRYFLLSTAARRARGEGNRHATMLVHTSQYTSVHSSLRREIDRHASALADRFVAGDDGVVTQLRDQWVHECERVPARDFAQEPVEWDRLASELPAVFRDLRVIEDNSVSTARLDYGGASQVVVAVGGNTLSRGLTLEGLSVSYFVRSASAYDTLLQMGRWFGYRRGYADLTRIWMTDEMRGWFRHLATVEQEIRYDIERYEAEHRSPRDLAPRIRTHPKLAITAAAKMQGAIRAQVSYSGRRLQTILFNHTDRDWLEANLVAGRELMRTVGETTGEGPSSRPGTHIWRTVDSGIVLDFLDAYSFHENSRDLNSTAIASYVRRQIEDGELRHFSVAVMGLPAEDPQLGRVDLGTGAEVPCINRARLDHVDRNYADIKALMSLSDRIVDLDISQADFNAMEPPALSKARDAPPVGHGDGSGLLALYPVSMHSAPRRGKARKPLEAAAHVLGVGIVFPTSTTEVLGVDYMTADLSSEQREKPGPEDDVDDDEETVAA